MIVISLVIELYQYRTEAEPIFFSRHKTRDALSPQHERLETVIQPVCQGEKENKN